MVFSKSVLSLAAFLYMSLTCQALERSLEHQHQTKFFRRWALAGGNSAPVVDRDTIRDPIRGFEGTVLLSAENGEESWVSTGNRGEKAGYYEASLWILGGGNWTKARMSVILSREEKKYREVEFVASEKKWRKVTIKNLYLSIQQDFKLGAKIVAGPNEKAWFNVDGWEFRKLPDQGSALVNGQFERGEYGWTYPTSFKTFPTSQAGKGRKGSDALGVWFPKDAQTMFETTRFVSEPGKYIASIFCKGSGELNNATMKVYINQKDVGYSVDILPLPNKWMKFKIRRITVNPGDEVTLKVFIDAKARTSIRFDDASLSKPRKKVERVATIQVAFGFRYTMILQADGKLYGTGTNDYGKLGDGTDVQRFSPVEIMSDVASVSAYESHTMAIKKDGTLWGWGKNIHGELGDGTYITRMKPTQIMTDVAAVAAGSTHTLILKTDGTLWVTGSNSYGALGKPTLGIQNVPKKLMSNVAAVAAAEDASFILKKDGTLLGCGRNEVYGLFLVDPEQAEVRTPVKLMEDVVAVATSNVRVMVLKSDGTLVGWGNNPRGQIGDGTTSNRFSPVEVLTDVASVAAGSYHTLAIKTDGTLWGAGTGGSALGLGSKLQALQFEMIMSDVAFCAAGGGYSMVIKTDGSLWGTGDNTYGTLGDGSTVSSQLFKRIEF